MDLPTTSSITKSRSGDANDVHTLYNAAMIIKTQLRSGTNPLREKWPSLAKDLDVPVAESMISIPLCNFMAWALGASQDVSLEKFVDVDQSTHFKILSILQDLLYLESKGQKTTLKHYCLGMMLHHLSGSSSIVEILNKFGHCSPRLTLSSLENVLAQLQANCGEQQLPEGFSSLYTTVVWDNIDFNEETSSGKATTHHTNGIIVQKISQSSLLLPGESAKTSSLPRRKHIIQSQPVKVLPYKKKKRLGPQLSATSSSSTCLKKGSASHSNTAYSFTVYGFLKTFDDEGSIPTWTGYNTLLCKSDNLVQHRIGYLLMIPASPTSYDTVYATLKRSVAIADQLNIPTITIVFDMAIYIKAQDIRWADNELLNRTAIRLGEFHTCMTFLSVIGKRFSDAGLMELLVESEVGATGSVNAVLEGRHYNRAISAHKIVVEAMEHLRFEAYYNSVSEERQKELSDLAKLMISVFPSTSYCDLLQEGGVQSFLSHYNLLSFCFAYFCPVAVVY